MRWYYILILALILTGCSQNSEGPIVTFTFDDGTSGQYEYAFPVLSEYGYDASIFVISGRLGTEFEGLSLMSEKQLRTLQAHGWDVGSQTVTHQRLNDLSKGELFHELVYSKFQLEAKGFDARGFAPPFGEYELSTRQIVSEQYAFARTSEWGVNSQTDYDIYNLRSKWITNTTSQEEVQMWIDDLEDDEWLILMFHIVDDVSREYATTPHDFEAIVNIVQESGVHVQTITEVLS